MSNKSVSNKRNVTEENLPKWRFRLGILVFALSLISPLFIPLINASNLPVEIKTALSGLLVVGIPQGLNLLAVAVLGKSGFNYIKGQMMSLFKRYFPPSTVSRTRYRIGLVMFLLPLLFGWLAPYAPQLIPGYETHRFVVNFAGDLLFLTSLFVLGGDFWDKIRAIFIYGAKAHFPPKGKNNNN